MDEKEECNCKIQYDNNEGDFFIIKSCNVYFEYSSMRDAYATNDINKAVEWIENNKRDYDALNCQGYDNNTEV